MKYLYQTIADTLRGDSTLKGMVGYTEDNKNILRGFQPKGNFEKWITFYFQPGGRVAGVDFTPQIRAVPLIVRVYDREKDLNCDDMSERIILLLNGTDLSVAGKVHVSDCSYSGNLLNGEWNEEFKSYESVLRFVLTFRVDEIVGNSGYPDVDRTREWHDND